MKTLAAKLGILIALTLFTLAPGSARAQARCDAPQVLMVLDHSSSMGTRAPLDDGSLKWDAAVTAITELTIGFEENVDFGMMVFPSEGECTPGQVTVPVASGNGAAVAAALPALPPYSGHWTPMADSLAAAADYAPLRDPSRRSFVALITDGWEWCSPYESSTRFAPVTSTETLTARGITTFIIGFGDGVDSLALNRMAVTAGTALPGCDATSEDPAAADNCYLQVDDLDGLRDALAEIAAVMTEETCDGLDNDCDGLVDEDAVDASTWYLDGDGDGYGDPNQDLAACEQPDGHVADGTDCDDRTAEAHPGGTEICDGIDNDCDGVVDPGCDCEDGESRSCGLDLGECEMGEQLCTDGRWGTCDGAGAGEEICDGLDNDCDGELDEGAECPVGQHCSDGACVPTDPCAGVTCDADQICVAGECIDTDRPPVTDEPIPATGCACRTSASRPGGAALPFLVALAALAFLRRR